MVYIDKDLCRNCKMCIRACSLKAIILKDGFVDIDQNKCKNCGICIMACPFNAIKME